MSGRSTSPAQDLELLEALWRAEGANIARASVRSAIVFATVGAAVSVLSGRLVRRSGRRIAVPGGGGAVG